MSAFSSNPFDLLEVEDDSTTGTTTKKTTQSKSQSSAAATESKPVGAKKQAQQQAAQQELASRGSNNNNSGASRGGRRQQNTFEQPQPFDRTQNKTSRGRGARGGRGRGRGFGDGSKREFDRRGAPRKHPSDQAAKHGHALGSQTEDIAPAQDAGLPASATEESTTGEATESKEEQVQEPVVEEDDGTLTFEQYQEQLKAKQVADDLAVQVRKVEIDEKKWKGKPVESEKMKAKQAQQQQANAEHKKEDKKPKKQILSLDEFVGEVRSPPSQPRREFNSDYQPRGGRGGRGRGGSFRGGNRGGFNRNIVNPSDESAFPKLGA